MTEAKDPSRVEGYPVGNTDPDKRGRGGHPPIGRPPAKLVNPQKNENGKK